MAAAPGISWDRLLFSAKESVYKAWFPLARRWLGFTDADITINAGEENAAGASTAAGTFEARLLVRAPVIGGIPLTALSGRWLARDGVLLTAITVAAEPARWPAASGPDPVR